MFGRIPTQKPGIPSALYICRQQSMQPLYLIWLGSVALAYDCIRTLTTSVGLAIEIPIAPVHKAAKIFTLRVGFSPGFNSPAIIVRTGTYNPILRPANRICLYRPADSPLYNAKGPSSAEIVFIVPMNPTYLGFTVGSMFLPWIQSLTFAVSIGMVAISATHPAVEAANRFFMKNLKADSPSAR